MPSYICSMGAHYFQIAFQLHVVAQDVAYDNSTGGIFLSAFGNVPYNDVVSMFRPVLKVMELSYQKCNPSRVHFITQCILYRLDFFISKFKSLL